MKSLNSQIDSLNDTLLTAQKNSIKQQSEVERLMQNNKELESSNGELSQRTEQAETNYKGLSNEFNSPPIITIGSRSSFIGVKEVILNQGVLAII